MPAEWEPHAATLMAWPTRRELWGPTWEAAQAEYAGVANAIAAYEPVLMVVTPEQATTARRRLTRGVDLLEAPLDDSWLRDSGPIVVVEETGARIGVHFTFNSWGGKYLPYDRDAAVAEPILEHLGIPRERSPMVLEGGALTVDGEGTLITTEQCLLHPNRNPDLTREQIEAELRARLGVDTIIWLPYGQADDQDTDGHVDGVATYVRPGVVLAQTAPDPAHPDHERMQANLEVLRSVRDARGRPLEVLELPAFSRRRDRRHRALGPVPEPLHRQRRRHRPARPAPQRRRGTRNHRHRLPRPRRRRRPGQRHRLRRRRPPLHHPAGAQGARTRASPTATTQLQAPPASGRRHHRGDRQPPDRSERSGMHGVVGGWGQYPMHGPCPTGAPGAPRSATDA